MTNRAHVVITVVILVGLVLLALSGFFVSWTDFKYTVPKAEDERVRTHWDWLDLLLIPLGLGAMIWWLNRQERKAEREIQEQRRKDDQTFQERSAELERDLALDRQRENALQAYLERITELLQKENLRTSATEAEVRDEACSRTLTVLRGLDGARKGLLVRFLTEADLINRKNVIINLYGADLSEADLCGAHLDGARLERST